MRLYKMQITGYPDEAIDRVEVDYEARTRINVLNSGWAPEGWKEHVDQAIEINDALWAKHAKAEGYKFFWPSQDNTYLSRSAAVGKKNLVEYWGGTAIVLEADVSEFVEMGEAKRIRQHAQDLAKAEKLRAEARLLEDRNAPEDVRSW